MIAGATLNKQALENLPPTLARRIYAVVTTPWFSYLTILLLQLRVMWNIWRFKDLTPGDTSYYFCYAWTWFTQHRANLIMSPLYTMFYGSLFEISSDISTVTILHRLIIVFTLALLVLAIMRRLLPPGLAWIMAAWWVVLPVNFNALVEVHQFAMIPVLLTWLLALRRDPGPWTRGTVLALMTGTTVLVRNEMVVSIGFLAIACLVIEWRRRRSDPARWNLFKTMLAYAVPLAVLCLGLAWFFARSDFPLESLRAQMRQKHTLNMAQVYAYGYQQRHPEWTGNAFTDFAPLCERDFGVAQPSLGVMIRHNPRAAAAHALWNFSLLPSGIQLLLFDRASGSISPDYVDVHLHSRAALVLTGIGFALAIAVVICWWVERKKWKNWFAARGFGWLAILSVVAVSPLIVVTQRPRPEYLFSVSIFLMAAAGTGIYVLFSRWKTMTRLGAAMPVIMLAAPILMPGYYPADQEAMVVQHLYDRLRPFGPLFDRPDAMLLTGTYAPEQQNYLGHGKGRVVTYSEIFPTWRSDDSLAALLDRHNVNLFYLDLAGCNEIDQQHPEALDEFLDHGGSQGWQLVGWEQTSRTRWLLFHRTQVISEKGAALTLAHDSPFRGWRDPVNFLPAEGPYPPNLPVIRWALYPRATLSISAKRAGPFRLSAIASSPVGNQEIRIAVDGNEIARHSFSSIGTFDPIDLTMELSAGNHQITFDFSACVDAAESRRRLSVMFTQLQFLPATDPSQALILGGWDKSINLADVEGPYPDLGLPSVRWGIHPSVMLRLATHKESAYRLVTDGRAPMERQEMTIRVDGHEVARHGYAAAGVFEAASAEFRLSPGDHEITLSFSKSLSPGEHDSRPLAVLFRRLTLAPVETPASGDSPVKP